MDIETKGVVEYDATSATTLTQASEAALSSAKDLVIDSADMYQIAAEELREIKAMQKRVEEQRTKITVPLNAALKAVNDLFRAPAAFLVQAEAAVKKPMVEWTTEQERLAAVARREAEEQARKERERLAAIQREAEEAQRRAAEASRKAHEEAQRLAAAGDAAAAVAAQQEAQAQAEVAEAAQSQAEEAAFTADIVTFAPAAEAPAKVSGISGRVTYSAHVDDLLALIKAVAAGTAPIQAICADEKFLGAQARAFKRSGDLYPGVSIRAERIISARSA